MLHCKCKHHFYKSNSCLFKYNVRITVFPKTHPIVQFHAFTNHACSDSGTSFLKLSSKSTSIRLGSTTSLEEAKCKCVC